MQSTDALFSWPFSRQALCSFPPETEGRCAKERVSLFLYFYLLSCKYFLGTVPAVAFKRWIKAIGDW